MHSPTLRTPSVAAHYGIQVANDPRREKRAMGMTRSNSACYIAYSWGQHNVTLRRPIDNPYPAGRRRDEFDRGMSIGPCYLR